MQILLKSFIIALLLLLPFHAFGVTVLNNIVYGSEFGAPFWMKAWKEIFLVGIFLVGGIMIFKKLFVGAIPCGCPAKKKGQAQDLPLQKKLKFDLLDITIVIFSLLSIIISLSHQIEISQLIYGIKYDLLPLWLFLLLKYTPFSQKFFQNLLKKIGYIGSIIIFLGILFFFLPQEFFTMLGYSSDVSFHATNRPLASCQMISNTDICRAQSTLSGPNQLAAYLLLLLPLFLYLWTSTKKLSQKYYWGLSALFGGILLVLTFSRSAWIGGFLGILLFFSLAKKSPYRKIFLSLFAILPIVAGVFAFIFFLNYTEKIIARTESSSEHYEKSLEGVTQIVQNPLGSGLGTAGAASKYSDHTQVGVIPENWYLQIGIETGIGGMILFILIVFLTLEKIYTNINNSLQKTDKKNMIQKAADFLSGKKIISDEEQKSQQEKFSLQSVCLLCSFMALSIMALMLHSWESAVVSYTMWGILGIYFSTLSSSREDQ